jgi:predicted aminopeptidase
VVDLELFHQLLDDNAGVRRLRGCKGLRVMRNHEDPEDAFLLFELDDAEAVRRFLAHDVEILDASSWAAAKHEGRGFVRDEVEDMPY